MFRFKLGVAIGILLVTGTAWSSMIPVSNFSFESPILVSGNAGVTTGGHGLFAYQDALVPPGITGWTVTSGVSTAGIVQPNTTNPPFTANVVGPVDTGANGVPNGNQAAFLVNGAMYQDLTPIAGNGFYTATVDVGRRTDTASGAYSIILMTSGGATLAQFNGDISSLASGAWAAETVTYSGNPIPAGQQLVLELTSTTANQVDFDNVQVTGAPEVGGPTVFWTMLGVAGFWIYRRKRLVA
jgi:hypothetical protein